MGPLVTAEHQAKVKGYVDLGIEEGAELVVDGRDFRLDGSRATRTASSRRLPVRPGPTPEMRIYQEEIFGPVLAVVRAPDFEAAVDLVNEHEYGNGTAIFTRDGDAARDVRPSGQDRHGRRQRADPGADGLPQLRRLEALAVRRPPHARPRGRALLHPAEERSPRAGRPASAPAPSSSCRPWAEPAARAGRTGPIISAREPTGRSTGTPPRRRRAGLFCRPGRGCRARIKAILRRHCDHAREWRPRARRVPRGPRCRAPSRRPIEPKPSQVKGEARGCRHRSCCSWSCADPAGRCESASASRPARARAAGAPLSSRSISTRRRAAVRSSPRSIALA